MKCRSVIGWEAEELWEGERNVFGLYGSPGRHLLMVCESVCVCGSGDIFVGEQREEVGMTVPFWRVR